MALQNVAMTRGKKKMIIGRGYIALAVLVLALPPQIWISLLPQPLKSWDCWCISPYLANTYLIPKKMLDMLDVIFFLTTSTHLRYHLGGDLLKMRYVHHTGVILCDYEQSSQLCWSYLEHQKRLGGYIREKFTLADVSRPLPSSIWGPATSSLISVSHALHQPDPNASMTKDQELVRYTWWPWLLNRGRRGPKLDFYKKNIAYLFPQ